MAITYTATLNPGAVSMAAANWSDATGFGHANPKLLVTVDDENQTISGGLDQSGSSAVDLIHFIGGRPRVIGTSNGPLIVKPDNTYTTEPNFLWRCIGGVLYLEFVTNECPLVVLGGEGEVYIQDGAITRLVCEGPKVTVAGAADITTELIVNKGNVFLESSSDTVPTTRVNGGYLDSERCLETTLHLHAGICRVFDTTGTNLATANLTGGLYIPEAGNAATINRDGGLIDLLQAKRSLTLGGTAITNYGPGPFPSTTGIVTVGGGTTVDYAKYAGGAIAIPGGKG